MCHVFKHPKHKCSLSYPCLCLFKEKVLTLDSKAAGTCDLALSADRVDGIIGTGNMFPGSSITI